MREEGLSENEARGRFWVVDRDGLLHSGRSDMTAEQRVYAQPRERVAEWPRMANGQIGPAELIGKINATALLGLSPPSGALTESIARRMPPNVPPPPTSPLSNPTAKP